MQHLSFVLLGLLAGTLSGFMGLGGGILIIPALVYFFKLTQHQAQGTTLAVLVPPIGLLAAWKYYTSGNVKLSIAAFICLGFFLGGWVGAVVADKIPDLLLKRCFGAILLFFAVRMILGK
ncbi:MAG: sulfite exporter TauE/SafE family protein [Candidatus Omnitrophica bacterium]|nr:sulfite exporter TauE/SafE family protein [Candidatus Omnitrophota bacterium]